jgi:site-specific recombinase XerD
MIAVRPPRFVWSDRETRQGLTVRKLARMRVVGPLARHAPGFRVWLLERGYRPSTVEDQVWLMAHLSRWLEAEAVLPAEFDPDEIERFRVHHRKECAHLSGPRGLRQLLEYLRVAGVVPRPAGIATPVELLLDDYRRYLTRERGLVPGSTVLRERVARLFLDSLAEPLEQTLAELAPADVTAFVVDQCRSGRRGMAWAKTLISGLRSLLVFLHVTGLVMVPLVDAVPGVAGWRLSALPRGLEREQVVALLASCDRGTAVGRRDHAILMLLSRLGLRACEIAVLSLDDIDWHAGDLVIHGKGGQLDRLPLPHEVGETLADYLLAYTLDRGPHREVFLRAFSPRGPMSASSIGDLVGNACARAGIPRVGSHRLRHTLASELLAAGAPLTEIAPVLRHTNLSSTAIYAKVDRSALRTLARPWPLAQETAA